MAENLHNDPFEDFLKKTLSEHEEPAPADMWSRIEGHLPAGPAGGAWSALPRAAWWAVAATLCAAVVTWQFMRYEHRIAQLEQALRQQQDSIALLHERWRALERPEEQTKPRYEVTPAGATQQAHRLSANEAPTASPEFSTAAHRPTGEAATPQETGADLPPSGPRPDALTPHESSPSRGAAQNVSEPPAQAAPRLPMQGTALAHPALVPLQSLTPRRWQPEVAPLVAPLPVLRAPRSGQSIAAEWTQLQTTRRTVAFKNKSFFGEKEFYDSTSLHLNETMAGMAWERPVGDRWQLRTGLLLRQLDYELAHQPRFKYGEGLPWGPPHHGGPHGHGPHHEQAFAYNLNTATGVLSLRLAVAPQDTLQPISPDEQITMNVRLRQRTSYLTIPIGIQYRQPLGRFSIACTAGLMANLLLHNEATLLDVQSMHPFFEPDKQAFDLKTPYARDLYLEGMTSIRLEYQPTRHWRIGAGPTFVGLLTSPHKAWYIQTKGWSVGWAASVQRLF